MKYLYQIGQFIIVSLLFTCCSPSNPFYFSKSMGSFGPYQKVQQITNMPDSIAILAEPLRTKQIIENSTVHTTSASNLEPVPLPRQKLFVGENSGLPEKEKRMHLNQQAVKNKVPKNSNSKTHLNEPENKKIVQKSALIGFILGSAAIIILLAGSFIAFAFGLVGAIFGIIGLSTIKKNPGKFRGRGFAWVGIAVGILIPLFIVGFILAFAGAFGGGN